MEQPPGSTVMFVDAESQKTSHELEKEITKQGDLLIPTRQRYNHLV